MKNGIGRVLVTLALGVSPISCGGDAPAKALRPVQGKVTYKGEPASGAIVTFQPEGEAPLTQQGNTIVPEATAGEDGTFSLKSPGLGDGAPDGKYKVLISWRPTPKSPAAKQLLAKRKKSADYDPSSLLPADPFDGRYSNPAKPVFNAEVKPSGNDFTYDLKD